MVVEEIKDRTCPEGHKGNIHADGIKCSVGDSECRDVGRVHTSQNILILSHKQVQTQSEDVFAFVCADVEGKSAEICVMNLDRIKCLNRPENTQKLNA